MRRMSAGLRTSEEGGTIRMSAGRVDRRGWNEEDERGEDASGEGGTKRASPRGVHAGRARLDQTRTRRGQDRDHRCRN